MTRDQVRKLARATRKIFATVPPEGDHLHVFVDDDAVGAAVQFDPKVFEELWWGKKLAGLRVSLSHAKPTAVRDLLQASWQRKATKRPAPGSRRTRT